MGIRHLHADHRRQTFPEIIAAERRILFLEQIIALRVLVDGAGQGRPEAAEMGAAFRRIDVVGVAVETFVVALVVLQRHLGMDPILLF